MAYIFQQLAKSGRAAGIDSQDRKISQEWYRSQAQKVTKVSVPKLIKTANPSEMFDSVGTVEIGKLYMFMYDPKHKDTLPYYDRFPLVIPIEPYVDGFLGLNLHYLPQAARASLMNALYDTINNDKFDNTTRMRVSYRILKNASRYAGFEVCLKRYLRSQMISNILYVNPSDWDKALMLPTERFVKARKSTVHTNASRR